MRLLNIHTMRLEEYFGSRIPKYSILSHCWGTDEATFQDINGPNWRSMCGAAKIEGACAFGRQQNQNYIWIDTCCIDKSSSAELSESINSMYSWYQRAAQCFVYLEDVRGILSPEYKSGIRTTGDEYVEDELRKSRWFTRGWTLQELIAPSDILFFNKEWKCLGERFRLKALLSSITAIPEDVLGASDEIASYSIAQKMSWAAGRETTREEDMAYCLLGLFGVNMPLLYGEGERAFIRLQEEILKESDDQSIFAWGLMNRHAERLGFYDRELGLRVSHSGVLAIHPAHFGGSAGIVPFPSKPDQQPFSMTNRGLRIEIPVLYHDDKLVGLLDCHYENDLFSIIGIYLEEIDHTSIFTRWVPGLARCTPEEATSAALSTIYIKKLPAITGQQRILKALMKWDSARAEGYRVLDIMGSISWDQDTSVFKFYGPTNFGGYTVRSIIAFQNPTTGHHFAVTLYVREEKLERGSSLRRFLEIWPKEASKPVHIWLRDLDSFTREDSGQPINSQDLGAYGLLSLPFGIVGPAAYNITAVVLEKKLLNQEITWLIVKVIPTNRVIEDEDE